MKQLFTRTMVLFLVFFMVSAAAMAQFTVTGTITDEGNEPLIGVSISVKGTAIGTISDLDGKYSLELPGSSANLEFSYTGYSTSEAEVSSSTGTFDLVMSDGNNILDEVVVTGLSATVKRSNLANAVASISSKELTGVTTQNTVDGALYGKFKGADIRANSGAPGGGFSIRLRGVTSVSLNQQPLYIIDGVYLDNSSISLGTDIVTAAAGGGNTSSNQDDASNRIADIIPEDIESIEILKGASAAAIYGVGGAGGVVIITTKQGDFNQDTRINFSQTVGVSNPIRKLGSRGWDRAKIVDVFGEDEAVRFDQNGLNDYEDIIFNTSPIQTISSLSISGGSAKTKFYLSGTYRLQDGLVDNTGYEKSSVRANVTHKLSDKIELKLNTSYVIGIADRGLFNNSNANTTVGYALAFTRPWDNLFADDNGNFPANSRVGSNPLETIDRTTNRERINRFFGSAIATYSILQRDQSSLKLGVELGLDQYTQRAEGLFPQELSFFRDPTSLRGVSIAGFGINNRTNISAYLSHSYFAPNNLSFKSQVGVIQLDADQNVVTTIATGLNGSQTNVDQSASVSTGQNKLEEQVKGFFFQESINWDDRIIFNFGLRGDKSSNNGDPNEIFWNPKASVAFNVHNFMDLGTDVITQIKPRFAYGSSSRFAGFDDRFNALDGTLIQGNAGLQTNALRGNPNVGPEKQTEIEFGADFGFLNNRILFNASYYIKTVDDLLLRAQVPASTGFTNQVVNAGELQNKGIELGIEAEPYSKGDFSWGLALNWWKNNSEVTRLDIPAFNTGGFAAFLGQGRIAQGQPATQLVGTIDPSQCTSDTDCSNVDPEGDGFMRFGDMEADFNMSWVNSIAWKGFELNWLLHWKKGGDGINLSTLLYDLGGVTWDYDDMTLDPSGTLSNGDFRLAALGTHPDVYIEDASYLRLREIGLYYNIPKGTIPGVEGLRVGVSGKNLFNSFDYNSYDPEVSNFGNNVLINSVEVTPYPSSKSFNFHLSITL